MGCNPGTTHSPICPMPDASPPGPHQGNSSLGPFPFPSLSSKAPGCSASSTKRSDFIILI